MADIDKINICPGCLHPVERLFSCPKCHESVKSIPSLLLETLRILRAKGWVVESWDYQTHPDMTYEKTRVDLKFFFFAPPVMPTERVIGGTYPILFELRVGSPVVLARSDFKDDTDVLRAMYLWAVAAPMFVVPMAQDFCDKCRSQGAEWFFCMCRCPQEKGKIRMFSDGFPANCVYATEQVVTFPNRVRQLEEFFGKNPIARRRALRGYNHP